MKPARPQSLPASLPPRLLSKDQAAEYCGVSAGTFLTHFNGRSIRIGTRILYDVRDLDAYIDALASPMPHSQPTSSGWLKRLHDAHATKGS